jgi:hypothetical protein
MMLVGRREGEKKNVEKMVDLYEVKAPELRAFSFTRQSNSLKKNYA